MTVFDSTSGWNQTLTLANDAPADTILPEGDVVFEPPSFIAYSGWSSVRKRPPGMGADGLLTAAGDFVSSTAYLQDSAGIFAAESLSRAGYQVVGVPAGVESGESTNYSGVDLLLTTETGGEDLTSLGAGSFITRDVDFDSLEISIIDVNGDGVAQSPFDVGGIEYATRTGGVRSIIGGGSQDVTALLGSKTKTVDLGTTDAVGFQFAGVEGTVETQSGSPIVGQAVSLVDTNGNTIATTTTNDEGDYSFPQAPVNIDGFVVAGEFFRTLSTRGEGQSVTRNFPATVFRVGEPGSGTEVTDSDIFSVDTQIIDVDADEPIRGAVVNIDGSAVVTGPTGRARGVVLSSSAASTQQYSVEISAGDRYNDRELTLDRGDTPPDTIELFRKVNTGNR
jgi:hypothetical protein